MSSPIEPRDGASAHAERSLSYLAADGQLALITDYGDRSTSILTEIDRAALTDRFPNARSRRPRGAGLVRVLPDERVEGYGTFTFPYGPLDAGVPEAGRFDVRTYGERVLEVTPVVGYKHRSIAAGLAGRSVVDAALAVERIAGPVSASHVAAFLSAAESAVGAEIRNEELWVRALGQELQRIYHALRVLGREAEAAAQPVGTAQTNALAEEVLRLIGGTFGHRWLFGAFLPGGPVRRLAPSDRSDLGERVARIAREAARLWDQFSDSRIFLDRVQTTCAVGRDDAIAWGAVGPTLRASGVAWDDRVHAPLPPYDDLFVSVPQQQEGDALARIVIRMEELAASAILIEQMLARWPASTARTDPQPPLAPGRALARVEAPHGDLVYDVTVRDGIVRAVDWRSPTEANLPLFALGMRNWVLTDLPFAFESFGFVFAEIDG